jgi:hypothetical protein
VLRLKLMPQPLGVVIDDDLQRPVGAEVLEQLQNDRVAVLGVDLRHIDHAFRVSSILDH